jgi:hypothetical protein
MRAAEEWVGLREILQDVRTRGEVMCPIEPAIDVMWYGVNGLLCLNIAYLMCCSSNPGRDLIQASKLLCCENIEISQDSFDGGEKPGLIERR